MRYYVVLALLTGCSATSSPTGQRLSELPVAAADGGGLLSIEDRNGAVVVQSVLPDLELDTTWPGDLYLASAGTVRAHVNFAGVTPYVDATYVLGLPTLRWRQVDAVVLRGQLANADPALEEAGGDVPAQAGKWLRVRDASGTTWRVPLYADE